MRDKLVESKLRVEFTIDIPERTGGVDFSRGVNEK